MVTRTTARAVAAEPRELDAQYCELVELCDRFAGRSGRLRAKVHYWLLVRYFRRPIAEVARAARRHESTVRGHVRDVDRSLRAIYGRPCGHPVEEVLGIES